MELVSKYMDKHQQHIKSTMEAMGKNDTIEATKVFAFLQSSFDQEELIFQLNGSSFFADDENASSMEKLIEGYYHQQTQTEENKKFYLYRLEFTLIEIKYILEYWMSHQPVKVVYNEGVIPLRREKSKEQSPEEEDDNQFDIDTDKIPGLIREYQQQIDNYKLDLDTGSKSKQQSEEIIRKMEDLNLKIKVLEQRLKATHPSEKASTKQEQKEETENYSMEGSSNSLGRIAKVNYQAIFQFYAKMNHLAGGKATFDRIDHETQSINYQKLVHFLRQFGLMPAKTGEHKKIHALYIKNCEKTRDLSLAGFKKLLEGLSLLLFEGKSAEERQKLLNEKLVQKKVKGLKLLNNPFHSLEKPDFRIDVEKLTYNFKLKPQDGKLVNEVEEQLEMRRKNKLEIKEQKEKLREQRNIRKLRKLQAIDPYNPLVLKNAKLLEQRQQVQPIASLDNMQKYRDSSFDFDSMFCLQSKPSKVIRTPRSVSVKQQSSPGYQNSDETLKKVEKLQRYEMEKMNNIMSGIIERSNAKMVKLGISPDKAAKFY